MKYKVKYDKYENLSDEELLEELLTERGVEDVKSFLNLSDKVLLDAKKFRNMEKALYLIDKYILDGGKVCIIVDSDMDGYTSGAFTYLELKKLNPNLDIKYILHDKKQHGIILKELENINYDFDILIVPDAGSADIEQSKIINKKQKDILILDHHEFEGDNPYAVLVNCQDGVYKNSTLSGVGVVYKFFKLYETLLKYKNYSDDLLDLVACGMIGDNMDLRNHETRYLCLKGIDLLNEGKGNKFIRAIIEKQEKRIGSEMTISKISWNIVPLINAVTRVGDMEEKIDTFKALIESKETREYQPRRKHKEDPKPPIETQDLQTFMARVITNIKARQDKMVNKSFDTIKGKIEELHLNKDKVIMIDTSNELESTFTGYVANKIASYYKRPALVLNHYKEDLFGGSGRNYELFENDNLRQVLLESNLFEFANGHSNAMGIRLKQINIPRVKDYLNNKFRDTLIEDIYHVDYCIPIGRLKEKHILQVGKFDKLWGNTLKTPLFVITDIYVDVADIKLLGEKQNVLSITKNIGSNSIKFIKLESAKDTYNKIIGRESDKGLNKNKRKSTKIALEIVGKFKINEYNDNQYPQIEIVDFNVLDAKREIKF